MTDFSGLSLEEFLSRLASQAPTPGGGTAAAAAGAMGAALAEMVAALTLAREKFADSHGAMRSIAEAAATARREFLTLASEDAAAYDEVVAARRLPKDTEPLKAERAARLQTANRRATEVPLATARLAVGLLARLPELSEKGNPNAASDAGSAALLLEAAARGALLNVRINLAGVANAAAMASEAASIEREAKQLCFAVLASVGERISSS